MSNMYKRQAESKPSHQKRKRNKKKIRAWRKKANKKGEKERWNNVVEAYF